MSLLLVLALALGGTEVQERAAVPGCLACHEGIEDMHPEALLGCVDCHGGNPASRTKEGAHVPRPRVSEENERVAGLDENLAWRRFENPMDLRVADTTCGECHGKLVRRLGLGLHGTTAGHLSDGFYEAGLASRKASRHGVFPVTSTVPAGQRSADALESLVQVPAVRSDAPDDLLSTHYPDLPRKECMQCHLWSRGRAVEGRLGFDGDYRGEGCAACHVAYALDGLSSSADRAALRSEPGHPERHTLVRTPTTQTCTACHYGDASIGLNFRGLSQLPPGAPGGPEIPGTTRQVLNRQFYLQDPAITPPDVHHERGMHCVDCHTLQDVMGDGQLHGAMEHAVEISCSDCHGTFRERATLRTQRGTALEHLRREGPRVILTGKVDGKEHEVVQVVDILDPAHARHNPRAARAMTAAHGTVECYTCHSSWNPNFLGFHFDRNASLTQLDLLTGERTPGRVTTQEKVFATWKSFFAGFNERGAIAPYLTGFSSMGSFTDEKGQRVLDQVMPRTAAGLSGMSMIHHQMHTVRGSARSCVECHRSGATWGLGSPNFQLARQLAFVADERGIEVVALQRQQLSASLPLAKLVLPDVVALALRCDPLQGQAEYLFAAEGARGVHTLDVRDPLHPRRAGFLATAGPQALLAAGRTLYVADGPAGVRVLDATEPAALSQLALVPGCDARALALAWPWLYVADGSGGLLVLDVREPAAPRMLAATSFSADAGRPDRIVAVQELFQYSRPRSRKLKDGSEIPTNQRSEARHLGALLDEEQGLILVDLTEPTRPRQLFPDPRARRAGETRVAEGLEYRGLVLQSQVDLAQPQGGARTQERDYAYVLAERRNRNNSDSYLAVWDVTDPQRPRRVANPRIGGTSESLVLANFYNTPFLQRMFLVPGGDGVLVTDASLSTQPSSLGVLGAVRRSFVVAVEGFPLDKMLDEDGRALKDVSHARSRWLTRPEIERILGVGAAALGLVPQATSAPLSGTLTARLEFQRLDRDLNGFLEDEERARGPAALVDEDGDERIGLAELVRSLAGRSEPRSETYVDPTAPSAREARVAPAGDLARLLDGVDPARFDADEDGRLDRPEAERAFFAALDLDDDGRLGPGELSRQPGEARQIRFGGARGARLFGARDSNQDGKLEPREFRLRDADWGALDADGDGRVQLELRMDSKAARRTQERGRTEWPARQVFRWPLPPGLSRETFAAAFDADQDQRVTRRELQARPDVLYAFDEDGDGALEPAEWNRRVDLIGQYGCELVVDGFEARWDLDGDGRVRPGEIPLPAWLLTRFGLRTP